jgi:DNA-binding MarR family transcriptional regulator
MKPSASLELRNAVREFVRAFGLLSTNNTPCGVPMHVSEAHALMELKARHERNEPPTLADLRNTLQIDKSNISRLCKRLQSKGLVHCHPCDVDGRAKRIVLTDEGFQLATLVDDASLRRFSELVAALPDSASISIVKSVESLTRAIQSVATEPETP